MTRKKFGEQEEQKRISAVAVKLLLSDANMMDGGWGDDEGSAKLDLRLDEQNCDGCAPSAVAERIRLLLTDHLFRTDMTWQEKLAQAKAAADRPAALRPYLAPAGDDEAPATQLLESELKQVVHVWPVDERSLKEVERKSEPYREGHVKYDEGTSGPDESVIEYERLLNTMPHIVSADRALVLSYRQAKNRERA